jgi:hypothetical protein
MRRPTSRRGRWQACTSARSSTRARASVAVVVAAAAAAAVAVTASSASCAQSERFGRASRIVVRAYLDHLVVEAAVMAWVKEDEAARKGELGRLLPLIRFPMMATPGLVMMAEPLVAGHPLAFQLHCETAKDFAESAQARPAAAGASVGACRPAEPGSKSSLSECAV